VEETEQVTHLLTLEDDGDAEENTNVFKFDPEYLQNEEKYRAIKSDILGGGDSGNSSGEEEESEEDEEDEEQKLEITDQTHTNIVGLRRTVYLTIMSSVDFEECAHKMMKMQLKPGQESEICMMIIECCSQERSFLKFYGLLAERFCRLDKSFKEQLTSCFQEQVISLSSTPMVL
jgi:pre-mRNA-splicing factor CWC22